MMTDQFEIDLQAALARSAADVPTAVGARLRDRRYYRRPLSAPVMGLAAAVVLVGTGTVVVSATHARVPARLPADTTASATTTAPYRRPLPARLTTVTFPLPAALLTADGICGTGGSGPGPSVEFLGTPVTPPTPGGGCLQVMVTHGAPPAGVTPVRVGDHVVALVTDAGTDRLTLYVDSADPGSTATENDQDVLELAVTAEGLSVRAVDPGPGPVSLPPVPCSGDCG